MSIIKVQVCCSLEPWHQIQVLSNSRPGLVHTVTIPFPDDPPDRRYCSCEGWKFRGHCQHCANVHPCGWVSLNSPDQQTEQQKTDHTCPRCGGPTFDDLVKAE